MCELFGLCAAESIPVNDYLEAFFPHSREHKDGWGLAVFRRGGVSLEKEAVRALDSRYLKQRLSGRIEGANLFAHIRLATIGRIEYSNCHPFVWDDSSGRTWTLVHNGTFFEGERLSAFREEQEGTTDSERFLMYIIHRMDRMMQESGRPPEAEERFLVLDEMIREMSRGNKLNLLIFDGEYMYIHSNCRETLYRKVGEGKAFFATTPLVTDGWEPLPVNRLLVYKDGRQAWQGIPHTNEFCEEDHDLTTLYSAFSEL